MAGLGRHRYSISEIGIRVAKLAGVLAIGLVVAAPILHVFVLLHTFSGGADGSQPVATEVRDSSGNLYGTARFGGAYGHGTVFEIDTAGNFSALYSFTGGSDGANPNGLVLDNVGNLYGTTSNHGNGYGTVFVFSTKSGMTVLHPFSGGADGSTPEAGLVRDGAGNLYGTTKLGGTGRGGTVFKISATGGYSVLNNFDNGASGGHPLASLILDSQGSLYGTTSTGGATGGNCGNTGCGVVFKLDQHGHETVLYRFTGGSDGGFPVAKLIHDSAGNLYGTTPFGGSIGGACGSLGCGVVFKLDTTNTETVLHKFTGPDGLLPMAELLLDSQNNLYGTTREGGPYGKGTVFKVQPSGKETTVHSFSGGSDGAYPVAGVIGNPKKIYSTSSSGGGSGDVADYKCCRGSAYAIKNP
jgi:uncharacterized repeat protein (TIGR03803 family)